MNTVKRHMKARQGPPKISRALIKTTDQYTRESDKPGRYAAHSWVISNLLRRFFSFTCGICGETYSISENNGVIFMEKVTSNLDVSDRTTEFCTSGFISCSECANIYSSHHNTIYEVRHISQIFEDILKQKV